MLGRIKAALGLLITLAVVGGRAFGQAPPDGLSVKYSHVTGMASLVTASDGGAIPLKGAKAGVADKSADFLNQYGDLFGITNPSAELTQVKVEKDTVLGYQSTKYEQKFNGVKVFGGVLKVHQNKGGKIVAANGNFYPIPEGFSTTPVLNKTAAEALAIGLVTGLTPSVEKSELVIIDQGWYGGTSSGPHLAYYILLRDQAHAFRRGFFVDAMTGQALEQWNMMFDVKNRTVYSAQETLTTNTLVLRTEGDPPSGDADGDKVYAFAGDVYDYYFRAFGRDSIDGQSLPMDLIVHINGGGFCPNAFWDGRHMNFCTGVVSDDVTAHELTHGVTDHEGGPGVDFYFYQPGQLNESLSDIFGELVDLFNGNAAFPGSPTGPPFWPPNEAGISGLDTPNNLRTNQCSKGPSFPDGIRWLMGEDLTAFGPDRAIRDMWDPTCFCNPDRAGSPLLFVDCAEPHNGSGVLNHGFALMTDGGVFNGQTITGVGPIKSGAIIYRALTLYLTELSDFIDAYNAINQAAQDLIGTFPNDPRTGLPSTSMFTAFDAQQVDKALISVEMNTPGACGSLHAATPCPTPDKNKDLELYSPNEEAGGGFGRSVSGIPNTAGDGLGDLVIGAFQENSGVSPQNAGKAYIFNGLFNTVPLALTSPNEETDGLFGWTVGGIPDVNGDGRGDVIVGAMQEDPGASPTDAGRAYIFDGVTGAALFTLLSPNEEVSGRFGYSVAGIADVNGDGRGDVIVGAVSEDPGSAPTDAGRAYIFSGSTGTLLRTLKSPKQQSGGNFGFSVAGVPDVDGDGRGDVAVGAPMENGGSGPGASGRVYIFSGSTGTLLRTLKSPNPEAEGRFGVSVSGLPDATGDGRGDVVVGAYLEDETASLANAGRAYVFNGATGSLLHTLVSTHSEAGGQFGFSVAGVPDFTGDGRGDIAVGCILDSEVHCPSVHTGLVVLFNGATGAVIRDLVSPHEEAEGRFGMAVAGVQDANKDGMGDIAVGAFQENPCTSPTDAGRAYLFSGVPGVTFPTPTPTPFPTFTASPSPTPTRSPSPTQTVTPSPTPYPSFTPSPTVSPSPTSSLSPTVSASPTPSRSVTVTPSPSPTPTVSPCPQSHLYGAAYSGVNGPANFYEINPYTGAAALIGPIGFQRVSAMDAHPTSSQIFATAERNDGSNIPVLITINTFTGAGTEVGPLTGGIAGSVTDISFRPSDGVLFAYEANISTTDTLWRIDPANGSAAPVGPIGPAVAGGSGNGIAFTSANVLLHTMSRVADRTSDTLSQLDQSTGLATPMQQVVFPLTLTSNPRFTAHDIQPNSGLMFGAIKDNIAGTFLGTVDINSGVVNVIGPTAAGMDAIAFTNCPVVIPTVSPTSTISPSPTASPTLTSTPTPSVSPTASPTPSPCFGTVLFGTAFSGPDDVANLYLIDPTTGAGTLVGATGFQQVGAIAVHPWTGQLYGTGERNDGSNTPVLITIDRFTGAGTEIGPTGISSAVSDISFRVSDGALFAYDASTNPERLYKLDPSSGAATLVGSTGLAISGIGNGMTFSADRSTLYLTNSDPNIYVLNQTTGLATLVSPIFFSPALTGMPRFNAHDIEPGTGIMYGSLRDNNAGNRLCTLNPFTGTVADIGPTVSGLDAIAFSWCVSVTPTPPPTPTPCVTINPAQIIEYTSRHAATSGNYGRHIAGVPDVSGDGRGDLIVGAHQENSTTGTLRAGLAYVMDGTVNCARLTLQSPYAQASGYFGWAVSGIPDVTGDGRGDVIVGAYNESDTYGWSNCGHAYIFNGANGNLLRILNSPNPEPSGYFGYSVAGIPDVNGDGRGDVAVGAPLEDPGASPQDAGRVYIFSGATGALLATLVSPAEQASGKFGISVAGVSDLSGDGRGDLIVGATHEGSSDGGRAYIFNGASGALLSTLTSPNSQADGRFGFSVAGVPDLNGDGRGDVIVGAYLENPGGNPLNVGRAYIFDGAAGGLLRTLQSPNAFPSSQFGFSVSGVRDLTGDGRGDVIVGAFLENPLLSPGFAGRAYIFNGSTGALVRELNSPQEEESGYFGMSVAGVDDVNNDGFGDVAVGAPQEDPCTAAEDEGRVYLFSGNVANALIIPANGAKLIGHSLPTQMRVNQVLIVEITYRNTGQPVLTCWDADGLYALGVLTDNCNMLPGNRINVPMGVDVAPLTNFDFLTTIRAPATPGVCTLQLQMVQGAANYFGDILNWTINVIAPPNDVSEWNRYE